MERWQGRVAVVTGASAGIGAAIAYQLQDAGVDVVGLARRSDKIPEAVETARSAAKSRKKGKASKPICHFSKASKPGKLYSVKCDITKEEDIVAAFEWVKKHTKGADILVNNAGVAGILSLSGPEKETKVWKDIMDINVLALSICTREAVQQMKARGVDDGHIVHISSLAGHMMPLSTWPGWAMYHASKHAVRVLTEGLRKELVAAKSHIRVTEVSPGLVKTDIFGNTNVPADEVYKAPHMYPEDIADAVLYAIQVPANVTIHEMMIRSTQEDY